MATNHTILHYPIHTLLREAVHIFERFCDEKEIKMNKERGLDNKIKIVYADKKIINFAELIQHYIEETNEPYYQITIWDNYCQYLWTLCYSSSIVMNDSIIMPYFSPETPIDEERQKKAYELFMEGMSLIDYTEDNMATRARFYDLPNPIRNPDDEYVQAANFLFRSSLCFLLLHEYHHFNSGHIKKVHTKTEEIEADYCAFYSMYEERPPQIKQAVALPIILALGSIILCDETMSGGTTHPDPDDRLESVISRMDDLEPRDVDYCYAMVVTLYKLWAFYYAKQHLIPSIKEVENIKAYYELIRNAVSNIKGD